MEGLGCPCEGAGSGVYFLRLEDWNRYATGGIDGDATQIDRPPRRPFDPRAVLDSFNANAARERQLTGRSTSLVEFLRFHQPPLTEEQKQAVVEVCVRDGLW
jgi:hypothetical protein